MRLLIIFAFYGSYYVKVFIQSKSGIKTDQMASGSKTIKLLLLK
ncbi:hypothetical protein CLPUN_08270 [Clostridium puniceum]|uniref:Uncharacterized protein n=1 Tax=Clostridium puniceum TaxID=29367 RepID=A0A1S8TVT1_9CLOT|nr:hypothetical protein [Clostridium puniceum]OOM81821.1 hypothetical protein CLPUN_08270 [Clostridium puniceum]